MTTTKKRLITILSFILAAAMLFGACKQQETDASKVTPPPTEQPIEVPSEVPSEAPSEVPSEMPTDAPTDEPTEAPTEAPTEEPFVSLQPGVLIEEPDNYTFEKDAAAGKVLVGFKNNIGGANPEWGNIGTYVFEGIKSPEDITGDTKSPVIKLHRLFTEGSYIEYDTYPISRPQDREYILNLIGNADYSMSKPEALSALYNLTVEENGTTAYYFFYYEKVVEKRTAPNREGVFAEISTEDLLRTSALAVAHWRAVDDQFLVFNMFTDKNVQEYSDYSLTLKYGDKETTLNGADAFALRDTVFGVLNAEEYPVKSRLLCNSDLQYSVEESIELIERYDKTGGGNIKENTCYVAPDGHIFVFRPSAIGSVAPGMYYISVSADYLILSLNTYSFDALLGYLN